MHHVRHCTWKALRQGCQCGLHVRVEPQPVTSILTRPVTATSNIWQTVSQDCLGNLVSVNWMRGGAHPRAYDSSEISLELCAARVEFWHLPQ